MVEIKLNKNILQIIIDKEKKLYKEINNNYHIDINIYINIYIIYINIYISIKIIWFCLFKCF